MTTQTSRVKTAVDATIWSSGTVLAAIGVATVAPRSVPYIAAGLVVLAVGSAVVDRLRPAKETTAE